MKILITGGAGYGGSGVTEELLRRGHSVRIIDIVGPNEAVKLKEFMNRIDYRWKSVEDINDSDLEGIDVVIHMAAQADVPLGFTAPLNTIMKETIPTTVLLEKCRGKPIKKFLLASTGKVIGYPQYIPIDEKHPVVPNNPYSAAKSCQECLAWAYYHSYKVPVAVMRNGIVYGPKMRKQIFLYIWMKNILEGKPITIEGGEQTRDPCYGGDTAVAWASIVEASEDKVVGHTFQVSRGVEWKMEDMARMCMKAAGKEVPINYVGYRPGEKGHRECFDNSFARKQVGYEPKVDLEDGLKLLWEWVKKEEGSQEPAGLEDGLRNIEKELKQLINKVSKESGRDSIKAPYGSIVKENYPRNF